MRHLLPAAAAIVLALGSVAAAQAVQTPCTHTVVGDLRVESLRSTTYGDERTIRVWLPPGYDASENAGRNRRDVTGCGRSLARASATPGLIRVGSVGKRHSAIDIANAGFVKMTEALAANLRNSHLNRPDVTLVLDPEGNHNVASWQRRLPNALTIVYGSLARTNR